MLHAVIMAGGSGTRFWPQSRRALPKQFLRLVGQRTMLQATMDRCLDSIPPQRIWVVTGTVHAAETIAQLPEIPATNVLAEPCARNTAACLALAAIQLLARDPYAVMLVLPADHIIQPQDRFRDAVQTALTLVERQPQRLVTFGVRPAFPATGYGYIERGEPLADGGWAVTAFREKPQRSTAEEFVRAGTFFWNCGIFVWRARRILEALFEFEPEMRAGLKRLIETAGTPHWDAALAEEFPRLKSTSIDYAVLERDPQIAMVEAPFDWDDVGSWQAVRRLLGQDDALNTVDGPHVGCDSQGCIIRSTPDHLIATLGVRDLIIVHTPDATLVAHKDEEEAVKKLVEQMRAAGWERYL